MKSQFMTTAILILFLSGMFQWLQAGKHGCCAHCKRHCDCNVICRVVEEKKKVQVTCWGTQAETFAVGGPSRKCEKHCETACPECDCDPKTPSGEPRSFTWFTWKPSDHATVLTKNKLMKKTETKTISSFKWVVEEVCSQCEAGCVSAEVPSDVKLPPPPVANVK